MLRTTGLAHDALVVLEEQGWDAFLALQAAQRRARLRLPWRRSQSVKLEQLGSRQQGEAEQQRAAAAAGEGAAEAAPSSEAAAAAGTQPAVGQRAASAQEAQRQQQQQQQQPEDAEQASQPTGQQRAMLRRLLSPAASLRSAARALSVGRQPRPAMDRALTMRGPVAQHPEDDFPLPPSPQQGGAAGKEGADARGAAGR